MRTPGYGTPHTPMTPHSVGGSLNELGEARGTVLAVKLDRWAQKSLRSALDQDHGQRNGADGAQLSSLDSDLFCSQLERHGIHVREAFFLAILCSECPTFDIWVAFTRDVWSECAR